MEKHETKVLNKTLLIGQRIKDKRLGHGLTVFNLVIDSGCSTSIIWSLEGGTAVGLTVRTIIKIATALNIDPDELFCEEKV